MFKYACGSTTGAGAAAGAATGAATDVPPHELQPAGAAHESQATGASQHELFLQEKIFASRPRCFFKPHPLSQDGAAQGSQAAISAPHVGAAPQPDPHGAISAPQVGAAQGSQAAISAPQLGAQANLPFNPQSLPFKPLRAERRGLRGAQHGLSTPQLGVPHGSHEAISAPQLGAAPQPDPHGAAISAPHDGSAAQPDPHGAISAPHDGSATEVSQHELDAPQPCPPSRRLNRSPPKLCPQRLAPRTNEPTTIFIFIEPNLPTYIVH